MKKVICLVLIGGFSLASCNKENDIIPERNTDDFSLVQVKSNELISEKQALLVASKFSEKTFLVTKSGVGSIKEIMTISDDDNVPLMYIVNYTDSKFVIVSASRNYYPILAYSDENNFYFDNENEGLISWFEETKYVISHNSDFDENIKSRMNYFWNLYEETTEPLQTKNSIEESQVMAKRISDLRSQYPDYYFTALSRCSASSFASDGAEIYQNLCNLANQYDSPVEYTIIGLKNVNNSDKVGPLLTTEWHQSAPFNGQCPNNSLAGCVAVAIAQIMKFHQFPNTFNWDNMPNYTATSETQRLIHEVGVAAQMNYGEDSSGSDTGKAKRAFESYNYNVRKSGFDYRETEAEILRNNRPVYMRGKRNLRNGHAWVCDGAHRSEHETYYFLEYQQGSPGSFSYSCPGGPSAEFPGTCGIYSLSFHMNWGWSDTSVNGWYAFNDIAVKGNNYSHNRENLYVSPRK